MVSNGYLPASALTEVQPGIYLSKPTAVAWRGLVAAVKRELGRTIAIVGPAGGYRSWADQDAMQKASLGHDVAAKRRWNLSTVSTARLASPGTSNHGLGVCVDVTGTPMDDAFRAIARRFGFTLPLPGDPNHLLHDGVTAIKATVVKKVAAAVKGKKVVIRLGAGDTLGKVAARYRTTVPELLRLNPKVTDPNRVKVRQQIRVA